MSESNTYENTAQRAVGGLVHCHDNIICIQFPLLHTRHSRTLVYAQVITIATNVAWCRRVDTPWSEIALLRSVEECV
ncbi:hypothetical protein SCLCIDRAFT_1206985 [Scleroderma citrinum Foug A]|uniref:Uncharacterized protein n=1 Tax=Scleroderma citrinum Foug A TaxID=1036808 RepID=A0A0C3ESL7_9AGAM|nr:hypothetical protein SCLCIDRAFT_1206985 [Scleroderma citrinum Foug A]